MYITKTSIFERKIYDVRIIFFTFSTMDAQMDKKSAKLDLPYRETISRLFIFRFLWVYIAVWPMMVLVFWVGLVGFVHFWYMLFMGKRNAGMWGTSSKFMMWMTQWNSYLMCLTDVRPSFWW